MSNADKKTTTPADVAKAVDEKLVKPTVPAQSEKASDLKVTVETNESPELTVIEGDKKTFGSRLSSITKKLKENKKVVLGVVAAVGVATLALVKFAATQVEDTDEMDPETSDAIEDESVSAE